MIALVIGGSGSGKSAYAEQMAVKAAGNGSLYYVATMQVYDEEGKKKVERHQKMRAGKGFLTIEQPRRLKEAAKKVATERVPAGKAAAGVGKTSFIGVYVEPRCQRNVFRRKSVCCDG